MLKIRTACIMVLVAVLCLAASPLYADETDEDYLAPLYNEDQIGLSETLVGPGKVRVIFEVDLDMEGAKDQVLIAIEEAGGEHVYKYQGEVMKKYIEATIPIESLDSLRRNRNIKSITVVPASVLLSLKIGSVSGEAGSTVQVPVNLTSYGEVCSARFDLRYDQSLLTYQSTTRGNLTTVTDAGEEYIFSIDTTVADNKLRVTIHSNSDTAFASTGDTLVVLNFTVASEATAGRTCSLELSEAILADSDDKELVTIANDGEFRVSQSDEPEQPVYTVTPVEDEAYTIGETDGIKTMTVQSGKSGLKYFAVTISPVIAHSGQEAVVFTHLRNDVQQGLNVTKADFDQVTGAQAGFNVNAGDVVKVFIVDDLNNDPDSNPRLLQ